MTSGESTIRPPVGRSGPCTTVISRLSVAAGSSMRRRAASSTSAALWGGMLVAMPTAIPDAPLASRLGNRPGITSGSVSSPL